MHNTKNLFIKMWKIYLKLRSTLIKFLNVKSIIVLKMETKNLIKNRLVNNLTKSYLLIGKARKICCNFYCKIYKFSKDKWRQV